MASEHTVHQQREEAFTAFAQEIEPRLRRALTALYGVDGGKEATADALVEGWKRWDRVRAMENPVGYLYTIGRNSQRQSRQGPPRFPGSVQDPMPWVEPALPAALESLSDRQRQVVMLVHGHGWSYREVAEVLGMSRSTVQKHCERSVARLRRALGVRS